MFFGVENSAVTYRELIAAMRADFNFIAFDNGIAIRTYPRLFLFFFALIRIKRPVMNVIGQAVTQIVLNVVDNDSDFVRVVGVWTE